MILPIHVYGDPVLREPTVPVEGDSEELQTLIDDMIETMQGADGIGLAAPQVGRKERLFVADVRPLLDEIPPEEFSALPAQPMVCINPEIEWESEEEIDFEEGCLSIPDIREFVSRPARIRLRFLDRTFTEREVEVGGVLARVLLHEYDHLEGVLFIDHLSSFRRRLLRRRLRAMAAGDVDAAYPLATQAV